MRRRPRFARVAVAGLVLLGSVVVSIEPTAASAAASCTAVGDEGATVDQDIDHDLRPDLVIGVPRAPVGALQTAGVVDIHYAADTSSTHTQRVDENSFAGLPAASAGDAFGSSTAFAELDPTHNNACHDLVIGAPGTSGGRGSVVIALGSTAGIASSGAMVLTGRTAGERFGTAVSVIGRDIWIGAPDRTVSGHAQAGAIDQYRITDAGSVTYLQTITEDTPGVAGGSAPGDHFGAVLHAALDYGPHAGLFGWSWPDQYGGTSTRPAHLLVGMPGKDLGSAVDAGSVTVLAFDKATHLVSGGRMLNQDSSNVPGVAERGDHFGASVWGWGGFVAVGVPGEDFGGLRDAGEVQVFSNLRRAVPLASYRVVTQNSAHVAGIAETGDLFGSAVVLSGIFDFDVIDLAVGAPGEAIGSAAGAGSVTVLPLRAQRYPANPAWYRAYYQGAGLAGGPEVGDHLGQALSVLTPSMSTQDPDYITGAGLVVGIPGEDLGAAVDAGAVGVLLEGYPSRTFGFSAGSVAGARYGSVGPTSHNG